MPDDVLDVILATAARYAQKPAFKSRDQIRSYAELETRVRQFAGHFKRFNAENVLIALPQGFDAYAAMLGAGLAGAFYTPVNVEAPVDKLRRVARSLQPQVIVAEKSLLATLKEECLSAQCMEPHDVQSEAPFEGGGTRHEIAYIIFTSGTTGIPKGVMIGREAFNYYVDWVRCSGMVGTDDHVAQFANIGFDISVTDVYGAFCAGATLYPVLGTADRMFPARFIAREKITVWNSTPSVFGLMMRAGDVTIDMLGSLRLMHLCGEPLLRTHLDAIFSAVPSITVQNAYGPTEATVTVTTMVLKSDYDSKLCISCAPIGPANEGMSVTLIGGETMDEGQIVISGPQVAIGYWQNQAETDAVFRQVEINGVLQRAYFTGDWAQREHNHIYFKERVDHQVKIHGFRIELDEIALAFQKEGYTAACVVKWKEGLAAVIEGSPRHSRDDLRSTLLQRLDRHAVPEIIHWMDHIPRSANDKLDRRGILEWLTRMETADGA